MDYLSTINISIWCSLYIFLSWNEWSLTYRHIRLHDSTFSVGSHNQPNFPHAVEKTYQCLEKPHFDGFSRPVPNTCRYLVSEIALINSKPSLTCYTCMVWTAGLTLLPVILIQNFNVLYIFLLTYMFYTFLSAPVEELIPWQATQIEWTAWDGYMHQVIVSTCNRGTPVDRQFVIVTCLLEFHKCINVLSNISPALLGLNVTSNHTEFTSRFLIR